MTRNQKNQRVQTEQPKSAKNQHYANVYGPLQAKVALFIRYCV